MNENDVDRIATAIGTARPDWPATSIATLIRKHLAHRPRRDVFVALAWVAAEAESQTPARVLEAGPWWRAAAVDDATLRREPYDPATFCDVCGQPEQRCRANPHGGHDFVSAARRAESHRPRDLRQLTSETEPTR